MDSRWISENSARDSVVAQAPSSLSPSPYIFRFTSGHAHLASPCAAFHLPLFYPRVHKTRREVGSGRGGAGKDMAGSGEANSSAEEACGEKKYGGMAPKKPLISKDHERAYFDSADWMLGKQAANSSDTRAVVESLKPKLKRTPHPQLPPRKPTCASS